MSDRLADLPNSHIAIMSYRTKTNGDNSTVDVSKDELSYIRNNGYKTKVWVGQELTNVQPKQITFFNRNWGLILREFDKINSTLKDTKQFKGIIINDLKSLEENFPN